VEEISSAQLEETIKRVSGYAAKTAAMMTVFINFNLHFSRAPHASWSSHLLAWTACRGTRIAEPLY
jgi:hypothetical protein